MSKRDRDEDDSPDKRWSSKRALFSELETDSPCVVAVDFGTAGTGYAYAFTANPTEIKVKEPGGQEPGKTLTCVLLDERGNYVAFGTKARDVFEFSDDNRMLFQTFKMRLHENHGGGTPMAYAINGSAQPLLKLIMLSLKYVKEEAMEEINRSQPRAMSARDIKWIVTVPAIWRDSAKGMMRRAAFEAGMIQRENSSKLVLCLEPEAACMACEDQRLTEQGASGREILNVDDRFMVLDCGGGTVDITMHKVEQMTPLRLSEIRAPDGGDYGSTYVDREYEKFLIELIGADRWNAFKPSSSHELMKAWEETKVRFDPSELQDDAATPVRINVAALIWHGALDNQAVENYNRRHGASLRLKRGHLLMPLLQASHLFKKVIAKITQKVSELLHQHPVQYIYLVGGFAESKLLQMRVRQAFEQPGRRVIVPMRPQLMVVKGAVLFGLQKGVAIQSRMARYTYGFGTSVRYDSSNEEHVKRGSEGVVSDGVMTGYVRINAFRPLVKQGTLIRVSDTHQAEGFRPREDKQTSVGFELYATLNPSAKWVDDPSMKRIGKVEVPCVRGETSTIAMSFGSTEISAKATNETTLEIRQAAVNFDFNSL